MPDDAATLNESNSAHGPDKTEPDQATPSATMSQPDAAGQPEIPPATSNKHWYVVKVQSGREESIKEAFQKRPELLQQQLNVANGQIDARATGIALRPTATLFAPGATRTNFTGSGPPVVTS